MASHTLRVAIGVLSVGVLASARPPAAAVADKEWALKVQTVKSPAADASLAPQLTSEGDRAILSWIERANPQSLVRFSEWGASGWSTSKSAASGNDLMINASDVPSVRVLGDGSLAAAWMVANGPDPEGYDLRLAFSKDGTTWSKPVTPHRDKTETQHGFASLFQAPGAGLGLVWLDGRATSAKLPHPTDNMGLRAAIFSRAGQELREVAIDTRVCDCCPTSIATTADGPIVAFRNRSEKDVRDIYVSRLVAGRWTMPAPVHADGWQIEACPINGPSVSARNRDVAVAWFTALKDEGKAWLAFSHDAGKTFGQPVRVDDDKAIGHVDVEFLSDGSAAVAWVEFANDRAQLRVRRIESNGSRSSSVTVAGTGDGRVAGHPRLALSRDELLFAWTETMRNGDGSHVVTAHASLK